MSYPSKESDRAVEGGTSIKVLGQKATINR